MPNKIAWLYDHRLEFGGVESHLLSLLHCIDPQHYSFTIIAPTSPTFKQKFEDNGGRVIPQRDWQHLNLFTTPRLIKFLQQEDIQLVHCHSSVSAIPGRLATRWLGLPVIVTVHLPASQYHGTRQTRRARLGRLIYTNLDRWLNYNLTDQLLYVSQSVHDICVSTQQSPAKRSLVIPNGINLWEFPGREGREEARKRFNLSQEEKIIIYCGRLDEQKSLSNLLEASAKLHDEINIKVWLVGDGPIHQELQTQTKHLGLDTLVHFWGQVDKIYPYLAASDIFVLPSLYEAMPISLLEALASGLPCIATAVGDVPNILENGEYGLLIPTNDIPALLNALRQLLNSPESMKKMSQAALKRSQGFSDGVMAQKVENIYNSLLGR